MPLALGAMNRLAHRSLTRQSRVWKSHFWAMYANEQPPRFEFAMAAECYRFLY
jgi:hypothetical protein